MARVGGVIIDRNLSVGEFSTLVSACDVYVSLHRSGEIGLDILDAMALGKPVVATAFASAVDVVSHSTACPVAFSLVPVNPADVFGKPGPERNRDLDTINLYTARRSVPLWADPDLDDAAAQLVRLHEHPEVRRRVGDSGREWVVRHNSAEEHAKDLRFVLEPFL